MKLSEQPSTRHPALSESDARAVERLRTDRDPAGGLRPSSFPYRPRHSLTGYVLLVLAATVALTAYAALRSGGIAYVERDGTIVFTSTLQSSGSDDSMVLGVATFVFGAFAAIFSCVRSSRPAVESAVFLTFWLLPLPFFYTEVGSFHQTVFAAHNWPFAAFWLLYWGAPIVALLFPVAHSAWRRLTTR